MPEGDPELPDDGLPDEIINDEDFIITYIFNFDSGVQQKSSILNRKCP
jgi:hypothetical protein